MLLPFTKYTICNNNRNEINHIQIISLIQASMDLILKLSICDKLGRSKIFEIDCFNIYKILILLYPYLN